MALGAVLVAACSLTSGLGGLSGAPPETEGDAAVVDGGVMPASDAGGSRPSDAAPEAAPPVDAGPDAAPPNLYPSGTFELGCKGSSYNSTLAEDPTARTGAKSCRVCSNNSPPGGDVFTIDEEVPLASPPVAGQRYRVEAWVRTAPGATAPADMVISLRTFDATNGFVIFDEHATDPVQISDTWQKFSSDLALNKNGPRMDWWVGGGIGTGRCFLVDDVVVTQLP